MKLKQIVCIGILLAAQTATSYGAPGEGVVLDGNGDYIITYADITGKLRQSKFVPATKIEPMVNSSFKLADTGLITYRYTISNGSNAKQPIVTIGVGGVTRVFSSQPMTPLSPGMSPQAAVSALQSLSVPIVKPDLWDGHTSPDSKNDSAAQISWFFFTELHANETRIGITPGSKQEGFGFASLDLPGVGKIRMEGDTPIQQGYEDMDGPQGEVLKQVMQLGENDFVPRFAAIPTITVPTPFDAALLLERIQTHVHTWIGMKLIDPEFSAQLDTSFKGAIDGYRYNQPKMGKSHIKTMRALLKKAYPDLDNEDIVDEDTGNNKGAQFKNGMIARLAARVLDFDLKYVLKQLGEE